MDLTLLTTLTLVALFLAAIVRSPVAVPIALRVEKRSRSR